MKSIILSLVFILITATGYSQSDSLSQNTDLTEKTEIVQTNLTAQNNFQSQPIVLDELIPKGYTKSDSLNKHIDIAVRRKSIRNERLEWVKVIGLYTAAIVLNGIGDGLNGEGEALKSTRQTDYKTWGHVCNAASIGLLVASPFLIDYDTKKWYWYMASYVSLRIGLFDVAYNLTRGLPVGYTGTTSSTDKAYNLLNINPLVTRSAFFVIGLSIPIADLTFTPSTHSSFKH